MLDYASLANKIYLIKENIEVPVSRKNKSKIYI